MIAVCIRDVSPIIKRGSKLILKKDGHFKKDWYYLLEGHDEKANIEVEIRFEGKKQIVRPPNWYSEELIRNSEFFKTA